MSAALFISLVSVLYLVPSLLYYLTFTCHLQFYRNQQIVADVVYSQRRSESLLMHRLAQVLLNASRDRHYSQESFREKYCYLTPQ
jgi:hypothetical protein